MTEFPLVSIVVPVYNREHLITESLRSAQQQTYKNLEIVVVDNQSTDNTWKVLQNAAALDSRIKIFQNPTNVGPVKNWSKCFEYAKGKYIKILWSDDLIEPEFISDTMAVFDSNVAFVMTGISEFSDNSDKIINSDFHYKTEVSIKDYLDQILFKNKISYPVSPGCAIFRTTDLLNNLRIDIPNTSGLDFSRFGAGNDLLLFLSTAKCNSSYTKIICIDKYLSKFRNHHGSITINENHNLNIYYDWSKWYFIKHQYNVTSVKRSFKSRILWRTYRLGYSKNLIKDIDGLISVPYFIKGFVNFMFTRLKRL